MKRLLTISLLFILVSACGHKNKAIPSHLLTEQEMVDVMTDVQILESDMNYRKSNGKMIGDMAKEYYRQLFEHYEITDSIYMENIRYYTHDPAVMERIMDSVTQRLTREQTEPRRGDSP